MWLGHKRFLTPMFPEGMVKCRRTRGGHLHHVFCARSTAARIFWRGFLSAVIGQPDQESSVQTYPDQAWSRQAPIC